MTAIIDPKLGKAIKRLKSKDRLVHAAFTLKNAQNGQFLSPERTGILVNQIVDRAAKKIDKKPERVVVFKNMQSFSIDAPASLIEELTHEDHISTAALGS